jgi:hypothetical protein
MLKNEGFPGYGRDNNGYEVVAGINRQYWTKSRVWDIVDSVKDGYNNPKQVNLALIGRKAELLEQVKDFYKRNFWYNKLEQIEDQQVATWLFDKGVQMGIGQAVKLIQRALDISDDGVFGPATLACINNHINPDTLVAECRDQAKDFYRALNKRDPKKYPAWMITRA